MKRDMDLVREILLATEASRQDPRGWVALKVESAAQNDISYHVELLYEAGLIEAQDLSHMGPDGYVWLPKRLTWQGHEFLDAVRDPEIWRKTKEGATKAGGFSLELLGALAKGYIRQQVKERTGIELSF